MIRPLAGALVLFGTLSALIHAQSADIAVRGRVVADDTGNPLPHARIVIYNDATPLPAIFSDAQGRFAATVGASGRYRLTATKAGYAATSVQRLNASPAGGVEVRMPRSASISGRVFDMYGDPVAGIVVSLVAAQNAPIAVPAASVIKTALTDDLGEYRLGGLSAGVYLVAISQLSVDNTGNVNVAMSYFPGVLSTTAAQPLSVMAGDQKAGIDFSGIWLPAELAQLSVQLTQQSNARINIGNSIFNPNQGARTPAGNGAIRGRITRSDGLAVPRATVTAIALQQAGGGPNAGPPHTATTDEDGKYEFRELMRGRYRIRASKPGFNDAFYGQQAAGDQGTPVDVADYQARAQIDFALPRHAAIAGQVFDDFGDPVEGATINVWQIRFQTGRRRLVGLNAASAAVTDDLGHYRVFGLPSGQYVVSAKIGQVGALAGGDVGGFAPTYFPGTTNPSEARLVSVQRSQDVVGIDLPLVPLPTASVTGKRIGSDGAPMGGSLVMLPSQRSGAIVTPSTGARIYEDGRFEFPNVAPGEYVIQADSGRSNNGREGDFVSRFITVNGVDIAEVILQATPGSTISGRVVFDGDPPSNIRGLSIEPTRADPDSTPLQNGSIARGDVRPDLTFRMDGIHGARRITLPRPPAGWMVRSVAASGVDVTDVALPFGTPDESLSDVEIVLTNRLTEFTGTVTDARGQPAIDYTLLVFATDKERWYPGSRFFRRVAPESAGNFTVRGLPPGDYFVAPVVGMSVLREGQDAWQDPEFLDSIALRATHAAVTDGAKLSLTARLITP